MLIRLENGDWVKPDEIDGAIAYRTLGDSPVWLGVVTGYEGTYRAEREFPSEAEARAFADRIAAQVNEAREAGRIIPFLRAEDVAPSPIEDWATGPKRDDDEHREAKP